MCQNLGRTRLFFPKADCNFFTTQLYLPTGVDISATEEMVEELEGFIRSELQVNAERPEGVTTWLAFVGGGEPRYILNFAVEQPNPAYAFLMINTTSFAVVGEMIDQVERFCWDRFPDVVSNVQPADMGPPVEKPIHVRLSGSDADQFFVLVDEVKAKRRSIPGTTHIDDDWARRAGVTNRDIAVSLQSILSGIESAEYREDNDLIPVTLRSVAADRRDLGKLETLDVYSQTTGWAGSLLAVTRLGKIARPSSPTSETMRAPVHPFDCCYDGASRGES